MIAIVITIMVLELRVPHGTDQAALRPLVPVFLAYVLSFINLGIYWNNYHHMLITVERINGKILWANLHLLFWVIALPFHHWLDGREWVCGASDRLLWGGITLGRNRVLHP